MLTGVSLAVPGQRGFSQDLAAGARSRADGQAAPALLAQPLPRALARDDGAWPGGDTLLSRSIRNTLGPIPMANGNEAIIREFIAAWSDLDAATLAEYFCDDGCSHNMPLEPVTGHEALLAFIAGFLSTWSATDWEIRTLLSSGDGVIAERIDKTRTSTGSVDLPCVGVFELEGGKIKAWRDYFDMATYMNAVSP